MMCGGEYPAHVARAAQYLHDNPHLFALVETINGSMDHPSDVVGNNGDGKVSVRDITAFLEFNQHLAVMEQNFDAFDTAAHPEAGADGLVSMTDLEALAEGEGEVAAAATWLLGHSGAWSRLVRYRQSREYMSENDTDGMVSTESLTLLAVDQQVYVDDPDRAGAFIDRRFEMLMSADLAGYAAPGGMTELFDRALTASDRQGELMERVIAEVAADGVIHNSGLNMSFADGVAANMDILDGRVNTPFQTDEVPDDVRQNYLDTARYAHQQRGNHSLTNAETSRLT